MVLSVVKDIYLMWQKALKLHYINRKKVIIYFKALIHQDLINIWTDSTVK